MVSDEMTRPERVQAAFDVWRKREETGPNATALFEYVETLEAALRAAVPEGEPVAWRYISSAKGAKWAVQKNYPEQVAKWGGYKIEPLYTHPAPRPDMERELAEAQAEIAILMNMRHRIAERQITLITERDTLAAAIQEAREVVSAIAGENRPAREWAMRVRDKIDAALSGASIPAPADETERYDPTEEEALALFMRLGQPEGRPAYFDVEPDTVIFRLHNEIIAAGDIRRLQAYLRASGFKGGKTRMEELMEQMPTKGGTQ